MPLYRKFGGPIAPGCNAFWVNDFSVEKAKRDETDVSLPSYGVVYDEQSREVAGVVRGYGSFFTLPEILLKRNNLDHWKNSTDGTATLLDPLRFDPVHCKELTKYFDLPYEIDEKWIDEANGLDAYGLKLADEFAESTSLKIASRR